MKINLVSDLHLNFSDMTLPGGDILIMAGDVFDAHIFETEELKTHPDTYKSILKYRSLYNRFIDEELSKYNTVLYVMGNHEHYNGVFDDTSSILCRALPGNVIFLEKDSVTIDNVDFFGATFWTNLTDTKHYINARNIERAMNDYRVVKTRKPTRYGGSLGRLQADHTTKEHFDTLDALKEFLANTKRCVVISHHAPSFASVPVQYKGEDLNFAYASELSELILDNPQIKVWVHGHMHEPIDYMIGSTRVIANPRGYHNTNYRENTQFNPNFSFEV